MYSSTSSRVTPCAASSSRRVGLLLQRRRQDVTRLHFLTPRALHLQHGCLQHAPECQRLLRFLLLAAAELLDRFLQVLVEVLAQLRQIGAAGGENPLAIEIVRQRVQECSSVRCVCRRDVASR